MTDADRKVSDLGESGLIDRILSAIGAVAGAELGGGDDTALVDVEGARVLFTTDALEEGVDFDLAYCAPSDVGWKAMAVNASDIAAMGGRPRWATVTVGLPPSTPVATMDDMVQGLVDAGRRYGIGIVGGDISRASEQWLSVAMIGSLLGTPVLRSGAREGDALLVTGELGGAAAGLRVLQGSVGRDAQSDSSHKGAFAAARSRQLRPTARVEQAAALAPFHPTAMIDLSDGLAIDLARVLRASGVACFVDPEALPLDPSLQELFPDQSLEMALIGGEDFELLFTIDPREVDAARQAVEDSGVACTQIGSITVGEAMVGDQPLETWEEPGWDHLRSR